MSEASATTYGGFAIDEILSSSGRITIGEIINAIRNPVKGSDLGNFMALSSSVDMNLTGETDVTAQMQALVDQYSVVIVEPGTYQILNLDLSECRVIGMPGAKFLGLLGARDNCVVLGSNGYINDIDFDIDHQASPYLGNGDYGNAVRVGAYIQQQGESLREFGLARSIITNISGSAISNAVSIFGNSSAGTLTDLLFRGRFGTGILTHWSGDVDPEDPHHSTIAYSMHPHGIEFTNIRGEKYNGVGGDSLITTSSSYNIRYHNVTLDGWSRILYLLPGDVYGLVANDEQRDKIMTGIRYHNFEHRNPEPRDSSSTNYPLTMQGLSATPRTAEGVTFATEYEPDIQFDGFRVVWDREDVFTGAALARIYYAKGVQLKGFVTEGFKDALCYGYEMRMSNYCSITGSTDTRYGNRLQASIDCEVDVKTIGSAAARDSAVGQGLITQDQAVGGTFAASASAGAESFQFTPAGSATINQGALVEFGGSYCTLTETLQFTSGVTVTVPVDGLPVSATSGDSVTVRAYTRNTTIKGELNQFYIGVAVSGALNLLISAKFRGNGRKDINAADTRSRMVEVCDCDFDSVGSTDAGSGTKANISIGANDGWYLHDNRYELSGGRKAERHILISAETSGLRVIDSDFGHCSAGSPIGWTAQSVAAAKRGRNQYLGNRSAVATGELPVSATFGYLNGGNYFGYAPSAPTSGYWVKGDLLMNPTASVGQPRGWQCTVTSENGGTWVSLGNL